MRSQLDAPIAKRRRTVSDVYDAEEFDVWSGFDRLLEEEEILLRRYFTSLPRESRILDVGTGAGRWLFKLSAEGFTSLTGIDVSERLLGVARRKAAQRNAAVRFERQDAADLRFADCSFDVVLALQQLLSLIEARPEREQTLRNFYRVLAPGGLLLASALSWEARWINPWLGRAIAPLKRLKGDHRALDRQYLPWLRLGGKPNVRFAFEAQPYTYWFRKAEFEQVISDAGFELLKPATSRMLLNGSEALAFGGMLYVIARKPAAQSASCLTTSRLEVG